MRQPNQRQTSLPRLFVTLIAFAVLIIGGIILLADLQCAADIEGWWAQPYPNAETIDIQYDLFRPRALGETRWTLQTSDSEETVRKYYQDLTLEILNSGRTRGLAWADRFIETAEASDGSTVTRIVLYSACGT